MWKRISARAYAWLVLLLVAVVSFTVVVAPFLRHENPAYQVGQVASRDIQAPYALQYESDLLTEQQREANARSVSPIYSPPDSSIARRQVNRLLDTIAYIDSVRADTYATPEEKLQDLQAMQYAPLGEDTLRQILELSEADWQTIQQEAVRVLSQVMQTAIRENDLNRVRSNIPALVSLSLSEFQADLVAKLVAPFVAPNSLYSESLTEAAREKARQNTPPVERKFIAGETIVPRGSVLTPLDIEALQQFGLTEPPKRTTQPWGGASITALVLALSTGYFIKEQRAAFQENGRHLLILSFLYIAFLSAARWVAISGSVWAYILPLSAFGMSVAALYNLNLAIFSTLPVVFLATYGVDNALPLLTYYLFSTLGGILVLHPARRLSAFVRAGISSGVSGMAALLAISLATSTPDLNQIPPLLIASIFQGILGTALTLILQFILAPFLGQTTEIQLMELARPDHPLLQYLLRQAPGTYQHSLQVANLAEQAAEQIGADAFLTRVGALYHDIGKAENPAYFIENQVPGSTNPHDALPPEESAALIIRHVTDGLRLAQEYHLPRRVLDFIAEHHGTSLTRYQYAKAIQAAGGDADAVDASHFRYPGPRPQSKETAILMLADGSEAYTRARPPHDAETLRAQIQDIIDRRREEGQLDDADLSFRDLTRIVDSFVATLRGVYHPRITYPSMDKPAADSPAEAPAPQEMETSHNESPSP